jgi:DNA-binding IscR family transcriptional regulator
MWRQLSNRVFDYLDGITLAETVEIQKENTRSALFNSDLQKSAA